MQRTSAFLVFIIAGSLSLFFSPWPVPAGDLSELLSRAQDPSANLRDRLVAIDALGSSGDEGAAAPLLSILSNVSEDEGVRSFAARALARLGEPRAEILAAFENVYNDPGSGENLLYTILLHFGDMHAVESLDLLSGALASPNPMIRFKAVQALGELKGSNAVSVLTAHLDVEKDRMVRAETVQSLGRLEDPAAQEALTRTLVKDPEPLVRYNAVLSLSMFKSLSPATIEALKAALKDSSVLVRKAAERVAP
ncbi:MAG: HEAT repeat domain-containing protein [Deltaproteobacteria bacterium]|nr:HEAT repeat domain-containing protein [Deltaproteobacteria bacterium]